MLPERNKIERTRLFDGIVDLFKEKIKQNGDPKESNDVILQLEKSLEQMTFTNLVTTQHETNIEELNAALERFKKLGEIAIIAQMELEETIDNLSKLEAEKGKSNK